MSWARFVSIAVALVLSHAPIAQAMEIGVTEWRGHKVLFAKGEIEEGDANRLTAALTLVGPLPHGVPVVLLDSPGGSVVEALAISNLLDVKPVHTIIPQGGSCASACASIVFIAGTYRTVEEGGRFGQHSCSLGGEPHPECNELLAQNAIAHGVSYGSVAAFVTNVPPHEVAWLSREDVDCWGISRYPFESESGFSSKPEPCFFQSIDRPFPAAQSAWRVDFWRGGYRAFLRPAADHLRELQTSLYCNEALPGKMFLTMEMTGLETAISGVVTGAQVELDILQTPLDMQYDVRQIDATHTIVTVTIEPDLVLPLLKRANHIIMRLFVKPPYETIYSQTYLSNSRDALIFAANHCDVGTETQWN